jgi:hypothetical protein
MSSPSGPPPAPLQYVHAQPVSPPQISPENLQQLQAAKRGMRKIRRAISTAIFDGWTVAVCGILTFLLGLGDLTSMALGAGLTTIGVIELYGAKRLKRLDQSAIDFLVWNQIALGSLLLIYAVWRTIDVLHHPATASSLGASDAQLEAAGLGNITHLEQSVMLAVYASLMVVAVFGQGSMALYYFTRRKHLQSYLAETPPWITQMQRVGMGI